MCLDNKNSYKKDSYCIHDNIVDAEISYEFILGVLTGNI